jgi:uncharacterized RDD family membrane protein YckC
VDTEPVYATFLRRLGAWLIDSVILLLVLILVGQTIRIAQQTGLWTPASSGTDPLQEWIALAVGAKSLVLLAFFVSLGPIYFGLCESSAWQATLGKRSMNVYVAKDDNSRLAIGRAIWRFTAKFLCGWFPVGLLSVITIIASPKKQAIHDFMAHTLAMKGRASAGNRFERWRLVVGLGITFLWVLVTFLVVM